MLTLIVTVSSVEIDFANVKARIERRNWTELNWHDLV